MFSRDKSQQPDKFVFFTVQTMIKYGQVGL
jgi:hypothetical protein